jgi:hypothetical protein
LNAILLRPPSRWERVALALFLVGWLAFGLFVEKRSAFMRRRMGDVGVYFRAGWAIREGGRPLYTITDDNGWHYHYPPLFAVLMVPLADPPTRDLGLAAGAVAGLAGSPGAPSPLLAASALAANPAPLEPDIGPVLPFPVSVALFYGMNLVCLALAAHLLAGALEAASRHEAVRNLSAGCRRWWLLRILPILICLPPLGHTLVRGQANVVLLLFVCGMVAALVRARSARAGLWLAGAVCLKLFPAYLLLVPLCRRDGRCLAGCALGLVVGLAVVPVAALGPAATWRCYEEQARVLVAPALHLGGDTSRAKELIEVTATDNQSFQAVLHNTLYLDRNHRPSEAEPWVRRVHLLLGAGFTLLTLAAGWRHRHEAGLAPPLFVGGLTLVMLLVSPVCHLHYFTLSLPLVMGLLALDWEQGRVGRLSAVMVGLMTLQVLGNTLPLVPAFEVLKDTGLAAYAGLALWLAACVLLWRPPVVPRPARAEPDRGALAA